MGIKIKGKQSGLFEIVIQPLTPYSEIKQAIKDKLSKNKDFFLGAGAKVLFSGKILSEAQKKDLKRFLQMDYDITGVSFSDDADQIIEKTRVEINHLAQSYSGFSEKQISLISKNYFDAKSVFVSHTLRSGQRIECEGDVVVLGDVNDGAEVIAGGSIAVMGTLRGLVHAGAMGRSDVVVAANTLMPKQLRISGKIAMFPEDKTGDVPEIAEYRHGSIVIKPLRPAKKQVL
ncbi:MAG: septum site-determining protein MinC [Christensenellales bacterium]|jgi:septum site-determining protein MinC